MPFFRAIGDALGLAFQQVQKYQKGMNRIGAGRLQRISGRANRKHPELTGAAIASHGNIL
jgi:hypothetical protein